MKNIKAGIQYIFIGCVLISSFSKTECQNQAKEEEKPVIKMYSFVSAPVDDVASADTPAHNLVIRSNLKGSIKIIVNKKMSIADMKVNVKMSGVPGSNFTDYKVKYRRKPDDYDTILLEVHESGPTIDGDKLTKITIAVLWGTAFVCSAATVFAILGCIGSAIIRKCKSRRRRSYETCSSSSTESDEITSTLDPTDNLNETGTENTSDSTDEAQNQTEEAKSESEDYDDDDYDDSHDQNVSDEAHGRDHRSDYIDSTDDNAEKNSIRHRGECFHDNKSLGNDNKHKWDDSGSAYVSSGEDKSFKYPNKKKGMRFHKKNEGGVILKDATKRNVTDGKQSKHKERLHGKKGPARTGERPSFHDDEDFLSVHRHGEYNSFVHEDSESIVGKSNSKQGLSGFISSNSEAGDNSNTSRLRNEALGSVPQEPSKHFHKPNKKDTKNSNQGDNISKSNSKKKGRLVKKQHSYHDDEDFLSVHRHGEYNSFVHEDVITVSSSHSTASNISCDVKTGKNKKKEAYTTGVLKDNASEHASTSTVNKAQLDIKANSDVNLSSDINDTLTVNGSSVALATEQLKSAHVISKAKTSSSSGSESEIKKRHAVKKSHAGKGIEKVIEKAINVQDNQFKMDTKRNSEKGREKVSGKPSRRYGGGASFAGHQTLFVFCIFGCLSISLAALPDLSLFQTVTADITIEIPDFFESVEVFLNSKHKNDVKVMGDQHHFKTKIYDVDTVSSLKSDNCHGKASGNCDTGTCDPQTGSCICQRDYLFEKAFLKCIPDCSRSCPFEFYMAKSCTVLSPGECKRCRSPCPKDQFESTACGGAMDRECADISKLPPVSVSEMIVTENRKKVKLAYQRLHPKKGEKLVAVLDRGTGIKVVVNVLEASFGVKVEEARSQNYDVNPSEKPLYKLCRHQMPVYYVARRHVLQDKFYYGQRKNTHCNKNIPEFKNDGVYCLNSDHDLIRLFTKGKYEKETFVHSEGSKLCEKLLRDCFNCADNCGKASLASPCIDGKVSCYDSCKKAKCDCSREECFCQKYIENCAGKASNCVGKSVSKITLDPIFSQQYLYCYVKILQLATYNIKTDIIVNGSLVVSKYREVITKVKNHGYSTAEDDFGYMFVKVSDSLNLNGKNLLLRRVKNTKSLEVGHFKMADDIYGGPATDSLALWPRAPYSLSKKQWGNMTCKRAQVDAFRVFDKYPISIEEPNIFEKLYGLSLKEEARTSEGTRVFSISKRNENRFIDVTMPAHKSLLRNIFPASDIIQSELHGSLLNKSSHWSVSVGGSLKSCPGSFTAKLFDQARSDSLLYHTDFAITRGDNCFFKLEFNMPFKNTEEENERAFVLHLITRKQTIKLVLLKEKKIKRILQMIHIPPVDKGRLLNAILPISVIAGGFVFLLVVLLAFGVLTKPTDQLYQVDVDNEFHFRHALVIVWFVCARLAKSILLTITFLSYIFVVIHSKNYHTLKSFNEFQLREKTVIKRIYEDMERHRVAEINRQEKRFTEEKNICEINMQKLDAYLAERKRDSSWKQQINKRAKSIKRAAIHKFEVRYAKIVNKYYETKNIVKTSTENHFRTIEQFVRNVKRKVLGHPFLKPAKVPYDLYRFFRGSKNWAQYVGLDVNLNNLNYYNRWESASNEIWHVINALRRTKTRQEKSENMNYRAWMEQSKSRVYEKPPMVYKIRYPKVNHGLGFDKKLVKKVFGVTWVTELAKKKVFSYIGMIMMTALDALFFVYRHTRTYAMAASMVYGFKKICDLDKMQENWEKDAEKNEILKQGFQFRREESSDHTMTTTNEEYTSDERGIVGEGLSTSTDEYEAKKKMGSRIFKKTYGSNRNSYTSSCSVATGTSSCSARDSLDSNDTRQNDAEKSDDVQHKSLSTSKQDQVDDKHDSVEEAEDEDMIPSESTEVSSDESDGSSESVDETSSFIDRDKGPGLVAEAYDVAMTIIGWLGVLLQTFVTYMKKINIVNMVLLNTHVILIFFIMSLITICVYFTILTAKFVLRTPVLDDLGFFDAKISPILTYRKVVNTRTSMNAFMINHIHIPYYEARMNARIEIYRLKAGLYKKIQCTRAVLHNSEFCSWNRDYCSGLEAYDDNFYRNLTQFKCHLSPATPKRYSDFDRVQFKNEMMRSYGPYVEATRGIILDTFQMIITIICIQLALSFSSKMITKLLLRFDLIRQIKVYQTRKPLETWDLDSNGNT